MWLRTSSSWHWVSYYCNAWPIFSTDSASWEILVLLLFRVSQPENPGETMDISSKIAGIAKRLPANAVLSSDFEFLVRCVNETRSIGGPGGLTRPARSLYRHIVLQVDWGGQIQGRGGRPGPADDGYLEADHSGGPGFQQSSGAPSRPEGLPRLPGVHQYAGARHVVGRRRR